MDPERTWEARAAQDKARYDAEIAAYIPPPGHDAHGMLIEENRPRKRTKRTPKDPAAPKRASGAYVFLTNELRPKIMQEFPGIKFVELGRILGERWRALTPPEKKRYEDMAAQDKIRFQTEMQQYTAKKVAAATTAAQQQQPPPPPQPPAEQYYHDPTATASAYEAYEQYDPYQPTQQHAA